MYLTSTVESISSAVNYGNSLRQDVAFACHISAAPHIRRSIQEGRIEGVSFPPAPKPQRKYTRTETAEDRRETVLEVHRLRHKGLKAREAAKSAGLCYQTYSRWRDDLGIEYHGECLRGKWRNNK